MKCNFVASVCVALGIYAAPSSVQAAELETFTNQAFGWSLKYPGDWDVDSSDPAFVTISERQQQALCGAHSVRVELPTAVELAIAFLDQYSDLLMQKGLQPIDLEWELTKALSGQNALRTTTELWPGGRSQKLILVENGIGVVIDCEGSVENWPKLSAIYNKVLSSFQFERSNSPNPTPGVSASDTNDGALRKLQGAIEAFDSGNFDTALVELLPLAENGLATAQFYIGDIYYNGLGVPIDEHEASQWFRMAAEQGHPFAMYDLGYMYMYGSGVTEDSTEGSRWISAAFAGLVGLAFQGDARAAHYLASMAHFGDGIPENTAMAVMYYKMAIANGSGTVWPGYSANSLGSIYRNDPEESFKWYHLGAKLGDASSQFEVGQMYAKGLGVQENDNEALKWFRMAAQHSPWTAFQIGQYLERGELLAKDLAVAVEFYQLAALGGIWESQFRLGSIFLSGVGVERDPETAYFWFRIASKSGSAGAMSAAENVGAQLPEVIRKEIEVRARACFESGYDDCD